MSLVLYYAPAACSLVAHVVANALNLNVDFKKVDFANPAATPGFLQVNPYGSVPALEDGDLKMVECGAIVLHMLNKVPNNILTPKDPKDQSRALQWLFFGNATLHPAYGRVFFLLGQGTSSDPKVVEAAKTMMPVAIKSVQEMWDRVEAHLGSQKTPFLAGKTMTPGDIFLAVAANWGTFLKPMGVDLNINFGPKTKALIEKVINTKEFKATLKQEGIEYNKPFA